MATSSRRRTAPAATEAAPVTDTPAADVPATDTLPASPAVKKPRSRRAAAPAEAPADAVAAPAPAAKRAPRKKAAAVTEPLPEPVAEPVAGPMAEPAAPAAPEAEAPKKPPRRRRAAASTAVAAEAPAPALPAELPPPVAEAPPAPPADVLPEPVLDAPPVEPAPAAEPAPEPAPVPPGPARIALRPGPRRAIDWQPGHPGSPRADELVARWQQADGALALADADALATLLAQLDRAGEPPEVEPAVWAQLALRGDLHRRIDHLSALYPQGLDGVQLPEADGLPPVRPCQLEAAFFAACVGACLIADEAPLQPLREAALAWQLVQRHFGAQRLAICTAQPADWQALLPADAAVQWCAPGDDLMALDADALVLDLREALPTAAPALPELPWCWVVAPHALLDARDSATAWLSAVDRVGGGALADWLGGAADSALAPLLLRRAFADVADQWPAWAPAERAVEHTPEELATLETLHQAMRPVLARWHRSGFLSDTDQLALQRPLRAREHLARAAAIGALPPLLQAALAGGAQRLVVFSADAGFLGTLAEVLQAEDLPTRVLPTGAEADAVLREWRDAAGPQVLLVADEAHGPRIATQPHRPVLVALDGAGDDALRAARLARVRCARVQREVPVWQLVPANVPTLPAARAAGLLRGEALTAWLQQLQSVLLPTPPVASATSEP